MDAFEIKARAMILRIFTEVWSSRKEGSIEEIVALTDDNFNGFGTSVGEVWKQKEDMRFQLQNEHQQIPDGYELGIRWLHTAMHGDLLSFAAEIWAEFPFQEKSVSIDPARLTGVIREVDGQLRIVQLHFSEPNAALEGEVIPGSLKPKFYQAVSIIFTDFVGFAKIVATISATTLVNHLNEIFAQFDKISRHNGLTKVKTIGDAYMAVVGLNDEKDHAILAVETAKEMLQYLGKRNQNSAIKWNMRIGIHSGPVVGGIIGSNKLTFDLWGDTVNKASRLETASAVNRINVSGVTCDLIKERYSCEHRGQIAIRDEGTMDMYFVH